MIESIILGIVQGIAEWLPISSEGLISLILVNFLGYELKEAVLYAIWLHLGTLLSVMVYFRKEILSIIKDIKFKKNSIFWFLLISTFFSLLIGGPIVLFGLDYIDVSIAPAIIGIMLIFTGIMQHFANKQKKDKKLNLKDSYLVGLLQGFAAMPGISRSGITTSVLLMRNYSPPLALKLSFLMSIPLVLVSSIYLGVNSTIVFSFETVLALLISFIVGLLSIKLLMKFASKINFSIFCIILGVLSILAIFI